MDMKSAHVNDRPGEVRRERAIVAEPAYDVKFSNTITVMYYLTLIFGRRACDDKTIKPELFGRPALRHSEGPMD